MKLVSLILAHASVDDVNAPVSPRDGRTPLHLASSIGNLAMAQLLIWVNFYFIRLDQPWIGGHRVSTLAILKIMNSWW
jgi:Ankyrin repeats (many copies)